MKGEISPPLVGVRGEMSPAATEGDMGAGGGGDSLPGVRGEICPARPGLESPPLEEADLDSGGGGGGIIPGRRDTGTWLEW